MDKDNYIETSLSPYTTFFNGTGSDDEMDMFYKIENLHNTNFNQYNEVIPSDANILNMSSDIFYTPQTTLIDTRGMNHEDVYNKIENRHI
ncbi:hypothetical protein KQI42_10915 [Tissierella sp. MSJ-40]|uniref:Uncharacterized protein n=1 Tax=Tissierella simiarum TaxID=2841534 RepID=A0ABS6E6H9_9FIRM|nr:hypothetical protein [Tissierella simiarum]MBU5438524.1 hypothetical protein [Tissierella simiarum]